MDDDAPQLPRPPVALGCAVFALLLAIVVVGGGFCIAYLESGTETRAVLDVPEAYAIGTASFIAERNIYLVRLADGSFLALSDLDAYNRARPGQRCRVSPIGASDPALPPLLAQYRNEFSPAAAGANFLFRDPCAGTLYDFTGVRVGSPGPNLDRHAVSLDGAGRITVDVNERQCTQHEGSEFFATIECPQ